MNTTKSAPPICSRRQEGRIYLAFRRRYAKPSEFLFPRIFERSLRGGQTGDGHTEGRAADVVQADVVAELDRRGVAAVLAADAQTQVGTGGAAVGGSHLDQAADADLIQVLERIALVDLAVVVGAQELG